MIFLFPYKAGSNSVKALSQDPQVKRIKLKNSKFKGGGKTVINWGASNIPNREVLKARVLNNPASVNIAANKLSSFVLFEEREVSIPLFCTDKQEAMRLTRDYTVMCRTSLVGSGGKDIVVAEKPEEVVDAPLYTVYVPKKSEWRVHIFDGQVIDVQRKVRDNRVADEDVNWKIRNHDMGFIFQRNGINPPVEVVSEAMKAVPALGLDFGAVDVIYNEYRNKAYVLEVNCAPGLEGETVQSYLRAFRNLKQGEHNDAEL